METLRQGLEEMLEIKDTAIDVKNACDWTPPRKESVSLKTGRWKLPKLKCEQKKRGKDRGRTEHQRTKVRFQKTI